MTATILLILLSTVIAVLALIIEMQRRHINTLRADNEITTKDFKEMYDAAKAAMAIATKQRELLEEFIAETKQ